MNQVYVIDALRTPFGSFGGVLADVPATELAATVTRALLERNQIDPAIIDQYIAGQVVSTGCGQAPARIAMRKAGLPDTVPAMTINKACGSGLKAMMLVADTIRLGDDHVGIAGGMENMSLYPYALLNARFGMRMGHDQVVDLLLYDALLDPESGRHMGDITEEALAERGHAGAGGHTRGDGHHALILLGDANELLGHDRGVVGHLVLCPLVGRGRRVAIGRYGAVGGHGQVRLVGHGRQRRAVEADLVCLRGPVAVALARADVDDDGGVLFEQGLADITHRIRDVGLGDPSAAGK